MTQPLPQLPMTVKGSRASVSFDGWTVTVRYGGGSHGLGEAAVPLAQLAGVEFRKAGLLNTGMFSLITPGAQAPKRGGLVNTNPLSVWVKPGQNRDFEVLRDAILAALAAQRGQQTAPPMYTMPSQPPAPAMPSLADELQRLGHMVQQGLLTPQEFEQAKARLLGGGPGY